MKYLSLLFLFLLCSCNKELHDLQFVSQSNTPVDSVSIYYSPEVPSIIFTDIKKDKEQTVRVYPYGSKNYKGSCTVTVFSSGKPYRKKSFGNFSEYTGFAEDYTLTLTNNDKLKVETGYIFNELEVISILWMVFNLLILGIILYAIVKLYRKVVKYLDRKS